MTLEVFTINRRPAIVFQKGPRGEFTYSISLLFNEMQERGKDSRIPDRRPLAFRVTVQATIPFAGRKGSLRSRA